MSKVRHVLGISGGKDSAALAIYMKKNYPELDIEYYTSDTGRELDETYKLIDNLFMCREANREVSRRCNRVLSWNIIAM